MFNAAKMDYIEKCGAGKYWSAEGRGRRMYCVAFLKLQAVSASMCPVQGEQLLMYFDDFQIIDRWNKFTHFELFIDKCLICLFCVKKNVFFNSKLYKI